ncbi:NAD(P)-binding protein [Microthyrium microscopicum]|uniref:NAD(P)-binding protein n=1 Tax=Microthyrium microscopicum TaxID=703497 RepID=A0A6A6UKL4_9PEZI|nr:NAD(P)-binding protein [Microthyrium microscopicum]
MSTSVSDKVIAITGAASGLGLATAHLLASRGALLSLADLNLEALEKAAAEVSAKSGNKNIISTALDVRNVQQVDDWVAATVKKFGRLDSAVNLAGVVSPGIARDGVKDITDKDWNFVIDINLNGVFHCMRAQLRVLADGGSIVNASSVAGIVGTPNHAAYAASKHAVIGLTKSAAKEVGTRGIRVNAICPGFIKTPMTMASVDAHGKVGLNENTSGGLVAQQAIQRGGEAHEVASLVAFLVGDESKYITGTSHTIDGGLTCYLGRK